MSYKTVTRRLQFCSGHRVFGHESSCANLHGHNYVVYIEATASHLDKIGRIIDFKVLKELFGNWIDENWDHGFLWYKKDPVCRAIFTDTEAAMSLKNYQCSFNPTAEEMAYFLLTDIGPFLLEGSGVEVVSVTIEETENCKAQAFREVNREEIQTTSQRIRKQNRKRKGQTSKARSAIRTSKDHSRVGKGVR